MTVDNQAETNLPTNRLPGDQVEPPSNGVVPASPKSDQMTRAEVMVDQLAEKVARFTALLGRKLLWLGARLREEAEDVWAEAKDAASKDSGRDAAVYVGLAATVALGAVELPIAAALGAGYAIFRRRR